MFLLVLLLQLLIKPIKYRLVLGQLTPSQSASLKVLSSVMLYLGRRTAGPNSQILVCNKTKVNELLIIFIHRLCRMNGNFHYIVMQILNQLFNIRK